MGDGVWNRDAVVAERSGFDCAKGHPAMGNYHHHQNPSAFNLDQNVVSTICDLYLADGLYTIDPQQHSPLIGFAYDGFPIYGAYGFKNTDGTGEITRMKSSFQLRNITVRTHYANGNDVTDGPAVNATYPLGYFREDYEYVAHNESDYLDTHNGRFCITPEYPNGTYCYFATVNENWNSAYPYIVGPTFYGVRTAAKVNTVSEAVTIYSPASAVSNVPKATFEVTVYPNPSTEFVAVQVNGLVKSDINITLLDVNGRSVGTATINPGSTIAFVDTRTLYSGEYLLRMEQEGSIITKKITVL